MAKTNLVVWLISERKPRVIAMGVPGPWTRREVEDAIDTKIMGGGSYKLELYDLPPPNTGADLPQDVWLRPSITYYARRLPGAPPVYREEVDEDEWRPRQLQQRRQRYKPYAYQPVLRGLHGRA